MLVFFRSSKSIIIKILQQIFRTEAVFFSFDFYKSFTFLLIPKKMSLWVGYIFMNQRFFKNFIIKIFDNFIMDKIKIILSVILIAKIFAVHKSMAKPCI